jgi:hypothetical protein
MLLVSRRFKQNHPPHNAIRGDGHFFLEIGYPNEASTAGGANEMLMGLPARMKKPQRGRNRGPILLVFAGGEPAVIRPGAGSLVSSG